MFKLFNNYDAPDSTAGGGSITVDDIEDLLADDKDDTPPKEEDNDKLPAPKESDDKDDNKDDDEEEIEIVNEKVEDDDIELTTPFKRKEILAKYPNLFKEFPYLEKAYYKQREYSELLPTIDAAREAIEKAESLDNFEATLLKGDSSEVLGLIKKNNPEAFNKVVDNYLPNLAKVDEKAYYHVVGNVMKNAVISMLREAGNIKADDEDGANNLAAAAKILNKFVFGHTEVTQPTNLAKTEKPEENEVEIERQKFLQERLEVAVDDVNKSVRRALESTIDINIDPRKSMTDYVRKVASREVLDAVYNEIEKDTRFTKLLDNLWREASTNKFNQASKEKIRTAFLSKAKTLLKPLIQKSRNEALKGLGKRVKEEDNGVIRRTTRPEANSGNNRSNNDSRKDGKGMSTLDFFNQD